MRTVAKSWRGIWPTLPPFALCAALAFAFTHAIAASPKSEADTATSEREIASVRAEQKRLVEQIRRELASLTPSRESSASEPHNFGEQGERRARLTALLAELEKRINAESKVRTRYVTAATEEPAIRAYYDRLQHRVEQHGNSNYPKVNGAPLHGRVVVVLTIQLTGRIESIEIARSNSTELANHSIKILKQLEPLEPFPPDMAKSVDRLVITTPFNYARE